MGRAPGSVVSGIPEAFRYLGLVWEPLCGVLGLVIEGSWARVVSSIASALFPNSKASQGASSGEQVPEQVQKKVPAQVPGQERVPEHVWGGSGAGSRASVAASFRYGDML